MQNPNSSNFSSDSNSKNNCNIPKEIFAQVNEIKNMLSHCGSFDCDGSFYYENILNKIKENNLLKEALKNDNDICNVIKKGVLKEVRNLEASKYYIISNLLKELELNQSDIEIINNLIAKEFAKVANNYLQIAKYFSSDINGVILEVQQGLRYGENPHQKATFYKTIDAKDCSWKQLQGKELSYNNLLDFDAAFNVVNALPTNEPAVAIVKHLNPCGAACGKTLLEALVRARAGDTRSHFGGIIAFNQKVDKEAALAVIDDFTEIVVAPSYDEEALKVFENKKNLRVLTLDFEKKVKTELRSVQGGYLLQDVDKGAHDLNEATFTSDILPTEKQMEDLSFAWALCPYVKSNAIVLVKDKMLIGTGAGQMSRIDSVEIALWKARTHHHDPDGAVAASDAFFPFTDCVEVLAANGIKAIIVPKGAKRDEEVVQKAKELGISLLFANERHFRH